MDFTGQSSKEWEHGCKGLDWIGVLSSRRDLYWRERLTLIIGGCNKDEPPPTTEEAFELLNEQAEINGVTGVEAIHSITRASPVEAFVIQVGNTLRI